ncbi:MAG: DegV family protein [Chloroflexi bacterium]|nr:DegV family protein [Chloroflexota bacterium]
MESSHRQKHSVAIVVDSATSLPAEIDYDGQLQVVPMTLTLDGKTYLDGQDVTPTSFYRMLKESSVPPTTSAPSPASYLESFKQAAEKAQSILCLTVGSGFSASFDSANTAAHEALEALPGIEISVLDSESAAGGEGLIALQALRAARNGDGLDDVKAAAMDVIPRIRLLAFLDTLYYLWKGGRVPRIAHTGTSWFRIKPLFELKHGEVSTIARPRTHKRAVKRLLELMRERAQSGPIHATVMHADALEAAEELKNKVEAEFQCEDLFVSEFTPVMGAHIGPGLLGIAFWSID